MRNGYFRLVGMPDGYGVAIYRPHEDGEEVQIGEILDYLDSLEIGYERKKFELAIMRGEDTVCRLGSGTCPACAEQYRLTVSEDGMSATVRFIAPSECGGRVSFDAFMRELRARNITHGIDMEVLQDHFQTTGVYCTDLVIARGKLPVQGEDARIIYHFNTDLHRRPAQREDGSVDYFHMTTINHCHKGEELARIIPEVQGENGFDIYGKPLRPKGVKRKSLKFGRNIDLSEDKRSISSAVDGHVILVDDKVFVSAIYELDCVGVSTGNIDFEGSVEIRGDVSANYEVKAGGNVIVNGLVEGAKIVAGGNIIIAKGMNGMGKGSLKAGGDIVVKFLENTKAVSGGYIETESIINSRVSAGTEVRVESKKGTIMGGYVQARSRIIAKTIGSDMGTTTSLEVGVNPMVKTQYSRIRKAMSDHNESISNAGVILSNFKDKVEKGVKYNKAQINYIKDLAKTVKDKAAELEEMGRQLEKLQAMLEIQKLSEVLVYDEIFPGTTIVIGDATKILQTSYQYCKFKREQGEVRMLPL